MLKLFILCVIFALLTGDEDCLSGLIVMGLAVAITVVAFNIHPILGVIIGFLFLNGFR